MSNPTNMDDRTKLLLLCGAIAGPLFTVAWFVEGIIHPDFDPLRHAISSLALGRFGWMQVTNFIVSGLLTLALAAGLLLGALPGASIWGAILIGLFGLSFLGAGPFITDPLNGYPPGTPPLPAPPSLIGSMHLFFSALAFGLPAAAFVLGSQFARQGEANWALYSRTTAIAFIVTYAIALAGFLQVEMLIPYAGLWQRLSLTIGLTWMTLFALYLMKRTPQAKTGKESQ